MAPASLRATWAKAREKPQVYRAPFWGSALLGFRAQGLEVWRFGPGAVGLGAHLVWSLPDPKPYSITVSGFGLYPME